MNDLSEQLEELKQIEGFPDAKDEDILKLSDEPFFTACPNPYLEDFINPGHKKQKKGEYDKKPFIGDVKESKRDSISLAHKYPTKSPWKGIMYFLMHYTNPGDIVLDGFAGTGMTGVAAQMCQNPPSEMKDKLESRVDNVDYGPRRAIMNELSPTGAFLSANYNSRADPQKVEEKAIEILENVKEECGWMYKTSHSKDAEHTRKGKNASLSDYNEDEEIEGEIKHIIWSDVFRCPYCSYEFDLWNASLNFEEEERMDEFPCPECEGELTKDECEPVMEEYFDESLQEKRERIKEKPVLINYTVGKDRFEKEPDEEDIERIEEIEEMTIPYWHPSERLPKGEESRRNDDKGLTHTHHYYSKRNLYILSKLYDEIDQYNDLLRNKLLFIFTSLLKRSSKQAIVHTSNFFGGGGGHVTTLSGNMYMPSFKVETNPLDNFERRISKANSINKEQNISKDNARVNLGSATDLENIPQDSIDYIFIDPPFGRNLMYSELNFFTDSWLKVKENNEKEAIMNKEQNKDIVEYENLMEESFEEFYRVLKPNRWITIEFNNSKAEIWNTIQRSLNRAGFIIAQVGVMDKKTGSFVSNTSPGSVKNDLIINAYKPEEGLKEDIIEKSREDKEAEFVREQLEHLPVRANIERKEKMLYSKMLAYFVENGLQIKYDSSEFYALLEDNFVEIDGYWFLEEQVQEYKMWKQNLELDEEEDVDDSQQVLVTDENSALNWLDSFLKEPKEYSDIYTAFQQIATMSEDDMPELKRLLDNNFILEDEKYRRPRTEEEKQKVRKERKKDLDKAFKDIVERAREGDTKIKEVRKEALIHGFTKWYQQEKYDEILEVADRLYKSTLESSGEIMDFVDIARIKSGEE